MNDQDVPGDQSQPSHDEAPLVPSTPMPEPPVPLEAQDTAPAVSGDPTTTRPGVSMGCAIGIAIAAALIVGTLSGGIAGYAGQWIARHTGAGNGSPSTITVIPSETEEPVAAAAAAALPAVVNIDVSGATVTEGQEGLPGGHPGVPISGNGSGVAWRHTEDGDTLIITNAHVVDDAEKIVVTGTDRQRLNATVIGADAETDVALIRVPGELPLLEVADSAELMVGQLVVAIGSPYGLQHSVTSGVISALGRSLTTPLGGQEGVYPLVDVIQTDAAINPGNSGGALVNREGKLIGINAAIYSDTGYSGGIGFAIPVNTAVRIAEELAEDGKAAHPFLGILGRDVDALLVEEEDLPVDEGAYIVELTPESNAEKAGLLPGDVVVMLDDDEIRSMNDLILEVRRHAVGDTVIITLYRAGERMTLEMEVGVKPDAADLAPSLEATPTP